MFIPHPSGEGRGAQGLGGSRQNAAAAMDAERSDAGVTRLVLVCVCVCVRSAPLPVKVDSKLQCRPGD